MSLNILREHINRLSQMLWYSIFSGLAILCIAGCELPKNLPQSLSFEKNSQHIGGAVADEPRAVVVAEEVLAEGGNAVDAAVALYFTLAVTYPSTASLGGGGVCMVYDPGRSGKDITEVIEFFPQSTLSSSKFTSRRPNAVPGNVRGMYALHARYGSIPWSQLLAPAEGFALLGHRVSRALAYDIRLVGPSLFGGKELNDIFRDDFKSPVPEGYLLRQFNLASVLSNLRVRGAGEFYNGSVARAMVSRISEADGALSMEDLRNYRPKWKAGIAVPFGNKTFHTADWPVVGGATTLSIFSLLSESNHYLATSNKERPHLVIEVFKRAFSERQRWLDGSIKQTINFGRLKDSMDDYNSEVSTPAEKLIPVPIRLLENPASTNFLTIDKNGQTVTCGVTMNNLFGTGRAVPGTGVVLAASPPENNGSLQSFSPIILVNHNSRQVFFVGGAGGGVAGPTSLASVMRGVLLEDIGLFKSVSRPRLHHGGSPDTVLFEPQITFKNRVNLEQRKHRLQSIPNLGRVNAIYCPSGMPRNPEQCIFATDPRGFGLATRGKL